jgi:hypothetical protein
VVRVLEWLAIITFVLSVIVGILVGNEGKEFEWVAAVTWWAAGVISAIFIFACSSALGYLKSIAHSLHRIEAAIPQSKESATPTAPLGNSRANMSKLSGYKMTTNVSE